MTTCSDCGQTVETLQTALDGDKYCPNCAAEKLCACGQYIGRDTDHVAPNGDRLCEACFDADYVTCEACDEVIQRDDSRNSDNGDYYCESCYDDNFTQCYNCHSEISSEDAHNSDECNAYCESCYDEIFIRCESCGCEVETNHSFASEGGESYCEGCYHDNFNHCDNCGNECCNDESHYIESSGNTLCDHCYNERGGNSYWQPRGFRAKIGYDLVGSPRSFGVEVETHSCDNHSDLKDSRSWGCKQDCSICGEEFWSDILKGNAGLEAIDELCEFAAENDWSVNSNCGLHVHLDMRSESQDSLRSIAGAFRMTYEVWSAFVEEDRKRNHYCKASGWSMNDLLEFDKDNEYNQTITRLHGSGNRYQWFNIDAYDKYKTFEIRLHEGTLDATRIKNWIRALTTFADWASQHSLADCVEELGIVESPASKFYKMCEIWQAAGCDDLVSWYKEMIEVNEAFELEVADTFTVSDYTADRIRALVGSRWQ